MSTRKRLTEEEYDNLCEYRASINKKFIPKEEFKRCGRKTFNTRLSNDEIEVIKLSKNVTYDSSLNANSIDTTFKEEKADSISAFSINKIKDHIVLAIPDLHAPFIKDGYLEFVVGLRDKHKPTHIIFLGDLLDNHFSSYHETDPDGYGAGEELDKSINEIQKWYKEFPVANSLLGNHTSLVQRKLVTAGVSNRWMKSYAEVLRTPNWIFSEDYEFDDVYYIHGVGGSARNTCRNEMQSVVQGHLHAQSYIEYYASPRKLCFAMQLGCGVNRKAYSMAYAKHFKKPQINCGVILDNGRYGIIEPMNMGI